MGKPTKLSDQETKWFLQRSQCRGRKLDSRTERERILIVCEGEKTEPNYFKAIKKELPPHVVELDICGEGFNTLRLVEKAQELRARRASGDYAFDQVWVVFDRDSFPPFDFDNAISKAEADGIVCAWSNEAFELWYVLHFEYRTTAMPRTEYQAKLTKLINRKYKKNAPDMYQVLAAKGNEDQAIKWAQRLHRATTEAQTSPSQANPCTTVYALVEVLNRYKPKPETETDN